MKSERRKAKRAGRREVAKLIGKRQADRLISLANTTRKAHDMCLCGIDERQYRTQAEAEAEADKSPAVVCVQCGKKQLRITYIDDAPTSESDRITLRGTEAE